jgi:hypothetical protein
MLQLVLAQDWCPNTYFITGVKGLKSVKDVVGEIAADSVSMSPQTANRPGINPGIVDAPELVFRRGGAAT